MKSKISSCKGVLASACSQGPGALGQGSCVWQLAALMHNLNPWLLPDAAVIGHSASSVYRGRPACSKGQASVSGRVGVTQRCSCNRLPQQPAQHAAGSDTSKRWWQHTGLAAAGALPKLGRQLSTADAVQLQHSQYGLQFGHNYSTIGASAQHRATKSHGTSGHGNAAVAAAVRKATYASGAGLSGTASSNPSNISRLQHGSSIGSSSDESVAHPQHPLPPQPVTQEEQQAFAKACAVIERLHSYGYKALIVGGWVRDRYLGRRASDIDIATNATPAEVRQVFRNVIELPRSTVKVNWQGEVLELTCFRGISRAASMFSVRMDAERRDFTINALYYDTKTQQVLDFVGGITDAKSRTLRLTADPVARLAEDPLRVLRGIRFAAVLGLKLAPDTARSLRDYAHLCSIETGLPARRIWLELRKLHRAEAQQPGTWGKALILAYHLGLPQHIFPWLTAATAQQAVQVSCRLQQAWHATGAVPPLGLLVAATCHPANLNTRQVCAQLQQYFKEHADLEAIKVLMEAARLTYNKASATGGGDVAGSDDSSSSSATATSDCAGSTSVASSDHNSASSSNPAPWVAFYMQQHAQLCLHILECWLPDALAPGFRQHHQAQMQQLAAHVIQHTQQQAAGLQHPPINSSGHTAKVDISDLGSAGSRSSRAARQLEELTAAIEALVSGDQQDQHGLQGDSSTVSENRLEHQLQPQVAHQLTEV